MFAISNDPQLTDSDIEYTRIKKREELQNGQVIYEISCQDVKITLPENPTIFFQGGGVNSVGQNLPLTPYQSIVQINQYVVNQSQKINSEKNSNKVGKSFLQTMVESLISAMATLVQPYLPEVFATISGAITTENNLPSDSVSFPTVDFVSSMCEINNLSSSGATEAEKKQKKEFVRSLLNSLLKDLIKLLLNYAIKRFKKFIKEYFAQKVKERQKRKLDKAKLKYAQRLAQINKAKAEAEEAKEKIQKYQAAINVLTELLGAV
jgi:methionyl-tRNA synthetase